MESFDLAVVGAGPAGMAAALEADALGLSVVLLDDQPAPGGQIWRGIEQAEADGMSRSFGAAYAEGAELVRRFRASGVDYRPRTPVWQVEPSWSLYTTRDGKADIIQAANVLLAHGAQERPAPFPGWTLPGVLTVGAAQIMLKLSRQIPEDPVWIAGSGPLVLLYATQLLAQGGRVAGILDTGMPGTLWSALPHLPLALRRSGDLLKGLGWLRTLRRSGLRIVRHVTALAAEGADELEAVTYRTADGASGRIATRLLLIHEGVIPSIHMTMALECEHDWSTAQQCFTPHLDDWGMTSREGVFVAGDASGIGGANAAAIRGQLAALGVCRRLGRTKELEDRSASLRRTLGHTLATRAFLDALYPPRRQISLPDDATIVCRCEEVTAGEIRAVAKIGNPGPNQVKSFTRCGMGPCQGRMCGYTVTRILAQAHGTTPEKVGFYRIRPPLRQVSLGELATLVSSSPEVR